MGPQGARASRTRFAMRTSFGMLLFYAMKRVAGLKGGLLAGQSVP